MVLWEIWPQFDHKASTSQESPLDRGLPTTVCRTLSAIIATLSLTCTKEPNNYYPKHFKYTTLCTEACRPLCAEPSLPLLLHFPQLTTEPKNGHMQPTGQRFVPPIFTLLSQSCPKLWSLLQRDKLSSAWLQSLPSMQSQSCPKIPKLSPHQLFLPMEEI